MSKLSHLDQDGKAKMVDVSSKADTEREAAAEATIFLSARAFELVMSGEAPKGDVLAAARLAGIMAAKKTSELIPLCHPLALSHAGIDFTPLPDRNAIGIAATAKTTGPTGVEMEALTAASVAALTIYDMVKAVDRSAHIESLRLVSKSGGKSGRFEAKRKTAKSTEPRSTAKTRATPRVLMHEAASPKRAARTNVDAMLGRTQR
jgi:cyclic pyranopterin phosphate synthase